MVQSSVLGFPRMGANRELKKANEAYWADKLSRDELLKEAKRLRLEHWKIQKDAGVDVIPSNDFAFYDHLLDHIQMFNVSTTCSSTGSTNPANTHRPSQSDTRSTRCTSSMSTSPWAAATRRTASTYLAW
jgi:5-methyltetrahydropteroyltriglutamate--homocysteine methyltransferase